MASHDSVRIVDYDPRWRDDFARLNLEWLERWFTVEAADRETLGDPEGHILGHGGRILFALVSTDTGDRAVGTVALKHEGNGTYELTKMAVEPDHRGAGIGRKLMEQALETYRAINGRVLYLETNTRLEPAIAL